MSGPPLDKDKLSAALGAEGVMLEAEAYFTAKRLDWMALHSLKYGDAPDTRELDVLAVKEFRLEMVDDTSPHRFFVLIECKYSANWWVFSDLSRIPPHSSYYAFPPEGRGVAAQLVDFVVESIREEHFIDEEEPAWVASIGEYTFGYKRAKRELFYAASRQVLSATAIDDLLQDKPFSKQMKQLALY